MKVKVLQKDLSEALSTASRFASAKAQLPVLGNIYLSASKNKLNVASTNLEVSVYLNIGADVKDKGEITVPAKVINDLVQNLKSGSVEIEVKKERMSISSPGFSSVISGMNTSDFPDIPKSLGKNSLNLSIGKLEEALGKTLFAASTDETRPVLTGVLVLFEGKTLRFVSTDGFRLSVKKLKIDKSVKDIDKLILPKNSFSELLRLTSDEDEIGFSYLKDDSQVVFGVGDSIFSTRVIEGEFPNFEKIIPEENDIKVRIDKEELSRAVKLSSVFARESANMIKLNVKKDMIAISSESSQSGKQNAEVDAKVEGKKDKKDFVIAFNYRFLDELLNSIDSEEVNIEFSDSNAPGVFTDPEDEDFLHLIMPVKLN